MHGLFIIKFWIATTFLLSTLYSVYLLKHPGVLVSQSQLDFVKTKRSSGEPWKEAYDAMMKSNYASLSFAAHPRKVVECGSFSNPNIGCSDERDSALAAYTHSLIWHYTGNKAHANKAIEIMDAWSAVLTSHSNSNAPLQSGWAGSVWPRAAEIIKHTNAGWAENKMKEFENMLRHVYLPVVSKGSDSNGNWELIMTEATGAIAVFLDDEATFNHAVSMWKKRVPAYMYLKSDGSHPVPPPSGNKNSVEKLIEFWYKQSTFVDGLAQETCRDLSHTSMGIAAAINMAETAYHQGVDLYKEQQERIVKAMEFHANYVNGAAVPSWLCGGKLTNAHYPMWEIGYNHYHNRLKVDMPHTHELITKKMRPTGTDNHLVAWETLTHAEDPSN